MSLEQFRTKFGDGIRPNLYEVTGNFGGAAGAGNLTDGGQFLIKSAAVPSASLGTITVPFRGTEIKRAGDRTFTDWTINVLCDEKMDIHNSFIAWSNSFLSLSSDRRGQGEGQPLAYADWTVTPKDNAGNNTRKFTLEGCWPIEVGTIDLSFDSTDAVAEFSVTIGFERWSYDGLRA